MSPLDDYHQDNSQNTQTSSAIRQDQAKKKNTAYIAIIAILIVVIIGGVVYFATLSTPSKDSKANDTAAQVSSSTSSEVTFSSNSAASSISQREVTNVSNAAGALTKEQITSSRALATDLAGKTAGIDAEKIINNVLTTATVSDLKTQLGVEAPTLKVPAGKTVELSVKYSSIGDSDFANASLYVKLSDGLTLVPGSMKDNFLTRTVDVNDSVYNTQNKLIIYGPGSTNKATSPMKVGENGTLTFRVQLDPNAASSLAVATYVREESGKIGQPSIFFVDVTN